MAAVDGELPVELLLSIQRVLNQNPSDPAGPFSESDKLPPNEALNHYFPDEASLGSIDLINARLNDEERELQLEIDQLYRDLKRDQDPGKMVPIQKMIFDLLKQMSLMREKATESEAVVRDITQDIQILDLAKENLISSMTTLKRLQMLVNALTQLEDLVESRNYAEIARSLSAVKELSTAFQSLTSLAHVARIWKRIRNVEGRLRAEIEGDFDHFYTQAPPVPSGSQLSSACMVVDIFPKDFRTSLIARYVAVELKDYRKIFRVTASSSSRTKLEPNEAAALDNIERRFAWFKRMLGRHEADAEKLFPENWKVHWALIGAFVDITRDDMTTLLSMAAAAGTLTVKILLNALAVVTEFETWAVKKCNSPLGDILAYHSSSPTVSTKPIAAAFELHMNIFVDAQDKALADMLNPHISKNTKPRPSLESHAPADAVNVLPSSTELFYFYGQSLEQCVNLGVESGAGKTLFDLTTIWRKWLKIYAEDVLSPRLKRPTVTLTRKSTDAKYDLKDINEACLVIDTADYCSSTASELEQKIRIKIKGEYKEQVSLQAEKDMFIFVISSSINVLLAHLDAAIDLSFSTMMRSSYPAHSQVSGPSSWIGELVTSIETVVGAVKGDAEGGGLEGKKYAKNFLDKCCSLILARFTVSLVKSRPLGQGGAEQLLIDLQAIKACLMKLPGDLNTASYTRGLSQTTARLEALLKVIVTPDDPPEGFILNYTLLIGDASFSNFQKILDLKGTPNTSQNSLLDAFVTITSTKSELENTSFLSSLDMDPSATSHLGGANLPSPGMNKSMIPLLNASGDSGPSTGDSSIAKWDQTQKKEKFSDFKRFVSFGLRRESA